MPAVPQRPTLTLPEIEGAPILLGSPIPIMPVFPGSGLGGENFIMEIIGTGESGILYVIFSPNTANGDKFVGRVFSRNTFVNVDGIYCLNNEVFNIISVTSNEDTYEGHYNVYIVRYGPPSEYLSVGDQFIVLRRTDIGPHGGVSTLDITVTADAAGGANTILIVPSDEYPIVEQNPLFIEPPAPGDYVTLHHEPPDVEMFDADYVVQLRVGFNPWTVTIAPRLIYSVPEASTGTLHRA